MKPQLAHSGKDSSRSLNSLPQFGQNIIHLHRLRQPLPAFQAELLIRPYVVIAALARPAPIDQLGSANRTKLASPVRFALWAIRALHTWLHACDRRHATQHSAVHPGAGQRFTPTDDSQDSQIWDSDGFVGPETRSTMASSSSMVRPSSI